MFFPFPPKKHTYLFSQDKREIMMDVEQILASAGVSAGAYGVYRVAVRLYQKYYINSECNRPNDHTTDIVVHISDVSMEVVERKEQEGVGVIADKVGQPVQ